VTITVIVVLVSAATYFATAEYFRPPIFLSLAEGMMEVCLGQASQARFPPPPNGWSLEWGRSWPISGGQYFMYISGWGLVVNVPLPFACLLLVPLAIAILGHRFPAGHCRRCGYDLTGNASGICPECGQKVH
jgi:hypothetical protein